MSHSLWLITYLQADMMTETADIQFNMISKAFVISPESLPTQTCHAATLAEVKPGSGSLMAAWFGGSQEGPSDVRIWGAHFENGQWHTPALLTPTTPGNREEAHWNPVLFNDGSDLHLHYKVGSSPRTWRGFHSVSTDGKAWSTPQPNLQGYLGPIRNKPIKLPNSHTLYPSSTEHHGWKVHFEINDGSHHHQVSVEDPQMLGAVQPTLLTHPEGHLQALCRTHSGVIAETWSLDHGLSWSPLAATQLPNPNSAIDAVTLRNGRHLLVYNPVVAGRTPLSLALSHDGRHWQPIMTLEDGDGEFSYPTVIEDNNGTIHIAYTWQRKAIRHIQIDVITQSSNQPI
ncbi:MAG: hypothetical protein B0D91_06975 [Oceanospirillales bacterium LUC14_002_19_P2]|nr:MAG: hypothetical protein B0D91_06975 [Oceanospirillales bacterium LUC14_002_19_P2]